jgi:hypothetical protein
MLSGSSLPLPRSFAGALVVSGGVYILGGFETSQQTLTTSVLLFNTTSLAISMAQPLQTAVARPSVSAVDVLVPGVRGAIVTAGVVACGGSLCNNQGVQAFILPSNFTL